MPHFCSQLDYSRTFCFQRKQPWSAIGKPLKQSSTHIPSTIQSKKLPSINQLSMLFLQGIWNKIVASFGWLVKRGVNRSTLERLKKEKGAEKEAEQEVKEENDDDDLVVTSRLQDVCAMVENDPTFLADKESFSRIMSSFQEEEKAHLHIFQKAIGLIEKADTMTTATTSDEGSVLNHDGSQALLRSIVKNSLHFFSKNPESPGADHNLDWWLADESLHESGLWEHRDVVLAWFESGLPLMVSFICTSVVPRPNVLSDEEVFLLIAQHGVPSQKKRCFYYCSYELLQKKDFLIEVLKRDPMLYSVLISRGSQRCYDIDLVTTFFAEVRLSGECICICARLDSGSPGCLIRLRDHLKKTIDPYRQLAKPSKVSLFIHLDDLLVKEIAQFLGLSTEKFKLYELAERNLTMYLQEIALQLPKIKRESRYHQLVASSSKLSFEEECFIYRCRGCL